MDKNEIDRTDQDQQDILVVDDNPASLQLLKDILNRAGCHVRPAPNGIIALRSVEFKLPDLILLDVKMPDIDGYEVCRRLKSNEKSHDIPVIFISGLSETTQRVHGFNVGGVDYIAKPFEPEEVLARVKTHLRLRELSERLEQKVEERTEELTQYKQQLEELVEMRTQEVRELSKALTVAEQRERRRMSHLLHDDLLQTLLSANLGIAMLSSDVKDNPDTMQEVSEVKQMILKAINSAKTLAVEFNPPILRHEGLDVALLWLIQHFKSQYGLEVRAVSLDPCREMDPDIRLMLVQLVRELFKNIVKHAKTKKAEISVTCKKRLSVVVRDRGAGFDIDNARKIAKARESVGLFSIEERLALIGGRLKIVSVPGKGTLVRIIVPIGVSFLRRSPS